MGAEDRHVRTAENVGNIIPIACEDHGVVHAEASGKLLQFVTSGTISHDEKPGLRPFSQDDRDGLEEKFMIFFRPQRGHEGHNAVLRLESKTGPKPRIRRPGREAIGVDAVWDDPRSIGRASFVSDDVLGMRWRDGDKRIC